MDKAVVLLSGGLDSVTLLHYVRQRLATREIHALTFSYGQRHVREVEAARWQARAAGVAVHCETPVPGLGVWTAHCSALTSATAAVPRLEDLSPSEKQQPPTYVPNRNMVFLALAAAYAESVGVTDVFYGAQAQDAYGYWDCSVDFVARMNSVLALNRGRPVVIHAPFVDKSKAEILRIGFVLKVDYAHTWSCYCGAAKPCGVCPTCVERARAFAAVGLQDPLECSTE